MLKLVFGGGRYTARLPNNNKKNLQTFGKIASPEDIIVLKSLADRSIDKRDIQELREILGKKLDETYIHLENYSNNPTHKPPYPGKNKFSLHSSVKTLWIFMC